LESERWAAANKIKVSMRDPEDTLQKIKRKTINTMKRVKTNEAP
jgi:hypothetical protein